jgi:hypothetical protein
MRGANASRTQLVWVSREGQVEGVIGQEQESARFPALSPDETRVAVSAKENEDREIWLHDVEQGTKTRLSFASGQVWFPLWAPGDRVSWIAVGEDGAKGWSKPADGSGEAEMLYPGAPTSFSTDGRFMSYTNWDGDSPDIWVMPLEGDGKPFPLFESPHREQTSQIAPDGRFIAYESDESSRTEIYVRQFPRGEGKWQISTEGGDEARWSMDGSELFFTRDNHLYVVAIRTEFGFGHGTPKEVFSGAPNRLQLSRGYSVSKDGQRFVAVQRVDDGVAGDGILVVENWFAEFKERP